MAWATYQFGGFSTSDGKIEVGILLPVSKQQRKLGEEAVVDVADGADGLGAGVAVDTAFESMRSRHQGFPRLKVIDVVDLNSQQANLDSMADDTDDCLVEGEEVGILLLIQSDELCSHFQAAAVDGRLLPRRIGIVKKWIQAVVWGEDWRRVRDKEVGEESKQVDKI